MKKAWLVVEILFGFAFALGAVLLLLFICSFLFPKRVDHDVWDILTAIGTVSAAVAAVGIATRDGRRRKSDEMAAARLAAAGISYRAKFVLNHVEHVLSSLDENQLFIYSAEEISNYAAILTEGKLWTNEELLLLIPLPSNCARNLAVAADQVTAAAAIMKRTAKEWEQIPWPVHATRTQELYAMLTLCRERLDSAVKTAKEAAEIFRGHGV